MQKGYIYQANGAWHVRYRVDGEQISRKLADYNDQYRTKRSVRPLAGEIIDPLNQGREVDGPMTLQQYAETVYFPNIKPKKSPSNVQGLLQSLHETDSAPSEYRSQGVRMEGWRQGGLAEWKLTLRKKKEKVCLDIDLPSHGRT